MSLNAFGCRRFVRELSGCTICVHVGAILIHVHVCTCTLYIHVATIMQKTKNVCNFTHSGIYFRKGMFCPLCTKVYYNDERDSEMVLCTICNYKLHAGKPLI